MPGTSTKDQNPQIETLRVDLGTRGYDILIGSDLIERCGSLCWPVLPGKTVVVVSDDNVAPLYLDRVVASLEGQDLDVKTVILQAGEGTKSFANFQKLCETILAMGIERKTTLIALGGGVIGDITGYAAASLLRGIPFIQIPTTLLAQVDSSVGGKTGINTAHGKNLVGAFYQPLLVLADTEVLNTLEPRQLLAGYAEVVKYGLIDDFAFFQWLESNGKALINGDDAARRYAVHTSCAAKAKIVAEDEKETGRRALLNLGHTFGHALEAETGYGDKLFHGEAVAIGMVMAYRLSARLGLCTGQDEERLIRHMAEVGLRTDLKGLGAEDWTAEALAAHMSKDKKVTDGKIIFVLAKGIGEAFLSSVDDRDALFSVLDSFLSGSK
jgi:3-dehydroquinate synthase